METLYKGSCLCGGVTFEAGGFSQRAANCHCSMCRKFHGAAFGTLVSVSTMNWISGQDLLQEFVANNGTVRTFCKACGSSLGFRVQGTGIDELEIAVAIFDENIPVKIDAQIYTRYKANWCQLDDNVPSYKEGRVK